MDEVDRWQGVCAVGGCRRVGEKMYVNPLYLGIGIGFVLGSIYCYPSGDI